MKSVSLPELGLWFEAPKSMPIEESVDGERPMLDGFVGHDGTTEKVHAVRGRVIVSRMAPSSTMLALADAPAVLPWRTT